MLFLYKIIIFLCFALLSLPPLKAEEISKIDNIDFHLSQLDNKKYISLNGDWIFVPSEFLDPNILDRSISNSYSQEHSDSILQDYLRDISQKTVHNVPGLSIPLGGYGTYIVRLRSDREDDQDLSFHLSVFSSAATVFLPDGKIINYSNPSKFKESEIAGRMSVWEDFKWKKQNSFLIIHVSNHHFDRGGFWIPPTIGNQEYMKLKNLRMTIQDSVLVGILFLNACVYIILYLFTRKDNVAIYFGIFSLIMMVIVLTLNQVLIEKIFPDISGILIFRLEYLSFYLGVPFLFSYFKNLYNEYFSNSIEWFIWALSLLASVSLFISIPFQGYVLPFFQFTSLLLGIYTIRNIFIAGRNRRTSARILFIGFILLLIAFLNDVLFSQGLIQSFQATPLAFTGFLLLQIIALSFKSGVELNSLEKTKLNLNDALNALNIEKLLIEKMTNIARDINQKAGTDLTSILAKVFSFFRDQFNIENGTLCLIDRNIQKFVFLDFWYDKNSWNNHQIEYIRNVDLPYSKEAGTIFRSSQRNRSFYLNKIPSSGLHPKDEEIISTLELDNLIHIPLIADNKPIGIIWGGNKGKSLNLTSSDRKRIDAFGHQIAGAILSTFLVNSEIEARAKAEKAKTEMSNINDFARLVNSRDDLNAIVKDIFRILNEEFKIKASILFDYDKENDILNSIAYSTSYLSEEMNEYFSKLEIKISKIKSNLSACVIKKRTNYFPDISKFLEKKNLTGFIDREIVQQARIVSNLNIPLIANNEVIGVLGLANRDHHMNFSDYDLNMIRAYCDQLASAVKNARIMEKIRRFIEKYSTIRYCK